MEIQATKLAQIDQFSGETLIRSFAANALLPLYPGKGSGPDRDKPYVLGASAPRTVLGMLHLTSYRLAFRAMDRLAFSIFLPAIANANIESRWFVRKFRVMMWDGTHIDFIRWRVAPVLTALNEARLAAAGLDWPTIRQVVQREAHKSGDWSVNA